MLWARSTKSWISNHSKSKTIYGFSSTVWLRILLSIAKPKKRWWSRKSDLVQLVNWARVFSRKWLIVGSFRISWTWPKPRRILTWRGSSDSRARRSRDCWAFLNLKMPTWLEQVIQDSVHWFSQREIQPKVWLSQESKSSVETDTASFPWEENF